jgi:hypothetical protein
MAAEDMDCPPPPPPLPPGHGLVVDLGALKDVELFEVDKMLEFQFVPPALIDPSLAPEGLAEQQEVLHRAIFHAHTHTHILSPSPSLRASWSPMPVPVLCIQPRLLPSTLTLTRL